MSDLARHGGGREGRRVRSGPVSEFHRGSSHLLAEIKEEEKTTEISGEKSDLKT